MNESDEQQNVASVIHLWQQRIREQVGGYDHTVEAILSNLKLLLNNCPDGVRGISIQGPPGSGKSHLASVVASAVTSDTGPEIIDIAAAVNGTPKALRDLQEALTSAGARCRKVRNEVQIVVVEKAEALAFYDSEERGRSNLRSRMVVIEMLVRELRFWRDEALPVVVLMPWASSRRIPAELCGSGAFEGHVLLPTPLSRSQRLAVLSVCAKTLPLGSGEHATLNQEADMTGGFLPCDLSALCRAAALVAVGRDVATHNDRSTPCITQEDFAKARQRIDPAATRSSNRIAKPCGNSKSGHEPADGLSTVVGQSNAVQSLQTLVVDPFRRLLQEGPSDIFPAPVGVLLTGEAGTGKTYLAMQLAVDLRAHMYAAAPADLLASRVGDAEKNVTALFSAARRSAPTVVILEDIDAIAPAPSSDTLDEHQDAGEDDPGFDPESETRAAYVLRTEIDTLFLRRVAHARLQSDGRKFPLASEALVLIVATARHPGLVAPWLLRPHRFSKCIQLEPEFSVSEVMQLLQQVLENSGQVLPAGTLGEVANVICSAGKGRPAGIVAICRAAAVQAVRRAVASGDMPCIKRDDLLTALSAC